MHSFLDKALEITFGNFRLVRMTRGWAVVSFAGRHLRGGEWVTPEDPTGIDASESDVFGTVEQAHTAAEAAEGKLT